MLPPLHYTTRQLVSALSGAHLQVRGSLGPQLVHHVLHEGGGASKAPADGELRAVKALLPQQHHSPRAAGPHSPGLGAQRPPQSRPAPGVACRVQPAVVNAVPAVRLVRRALDLAAQVGLLHHQGVVACCQAIEHAARLVRVGDQQVKACGQRRVRLLLPLGPPGHLGTQLLKGALDGAHFGAVGRANAHTQFPLLQLFLSSGGQRGPGEGAGINNANRPERRR